LFVKDRENLLLTIGYRHTDANAGRYPFITADTDLLFTAYDTLLQRRFSHSIPLGGFGIILKCRELNGDRVAVTGWRYRDDIDEIQGFVVVVPMATGQLTSTKTPARRPQLAVTIYPNPTADRIHLDLPDPPTAGDPLRLTVIDMHGRVLERRVATESRPEIDLSAYPAGYYLVAGRNARGSFSQLVERH
jgi:hypothetical protein